MTALDHRGSYPKLPHPPRRIPIVGDVLGMDVETPSQSAAALARLGPVYEFRFFGAQYVVAAGADAVMDLNDETRFAKHIGPDIEALRIIGGDGLFTAYNDEPNWLKAHQLLAGVHPMRKDDWALALTVTLHRDPRWGPDPDRFDPDRFLPERVHARPAGLYKPFGTGERSCIGRQFALHEAVLLLGVVLRRYDLIADPAYQLQIQERLTMMPHDFRLRLRRR